MLIPAPATASPQRPSLSAARVPLTRAVEVLDESGARRTLHIPAERPLTLYLDKRELVTLMTLGAAPELLTLGYLRNQRLVERVEDIESVVVDWEVGAAAVTTRSGTADAAARTRQRIVTTGCGQGTMFGMLMEELEARRLAPPAVARIRQSTLMQLSEIMRTQDSIHRRAGSVHGCALFRGLEMLMFVEDVGRHNAIDTIAGWMWLHGDSALGGRRQAVLYNRAAHQRDGDQGRATGRADRDFAQRRHPDGLRAGAAAGHGLVRPREPAPLHLLLRLRAVRLRATGRAGAGARELRRLTCRGFVRWLTNPHPRPSPADAGEGSKPSPTSVGEGGAAGAG
jgi:formate dehydrogenase accessory protein FdhD